MKYKLAICLFLLPLNLSALSFSSYVDGCDLRLFFDVISEEEKTVCFHSFDEEDPLFVPDYFEIPSEVQYDDNTYSITEINIDGINHLHQCKNIVLPNSASVIRFNSSRDELRIILRTNEGNPYFYEKDSVLFDNQNSLIYYPVVKSVASYVIPEGTKKIMGDVFYSNTHLKSVTIPDGVKEIGESAFYYCTELSQIKFGDNSIETIGYESFYGCYNLKELKLPPSIKHVSVCSFANSSVENLIIPDCDVYFDISAFSGSDDYPIPGNLKKVVSYIKAPKPIHDWAFPNKNKVFAEWEYPLATLYVPKGTKEIYMSTHGWEFTNIIEMDDEETTSIKNIPFPDETPFYDLTGKIINSTLYKGVVIHNNKKVILK